MEQIADLAAAQRVDDRPLYAPLRTFPACSGNCKQGRAPCVTPDACLLADDEPASMGEGAGVLIWPLISTVAVFCALAAVHLASRMGWLP